MSPRASATCTPERCWIETGCWTFDRRIPWVSWREPAPIRRNCSCVVPPSLLWSGTSTGLRNGTAPTPFDTFRTATQLGVHRVSLKVVRRQGEARVPSGVRGDRFVIRAHCVGVAVGVGG